MTTFQTWQLGTFLICRHLGTLLASADAVCSLALLDFLAFSKSCGQKMANMSTVASVVSYRSYKIIDTTVNMFINVGTQKHATGHFDQFEGISRPQRGRLGQFWLLLKR